MDIEIKPSEALEVTSILTHLQQLFTTVLYEDENGVIRYKRPAQMDDGQLMQCAASLRILLLDKGCPILLDFLSRHKIDVEIDVMETDVNLLLLSIQTYDSQHISDFFVSAICDPDFSKEIPLNKMEPMPYLDCSDKPDPRFIEDHYRWLPNKESQEKLNTWPMINPQNGKPSQLIMRTKRKVSIDKWADVQIGFLKDKPMKRKNLIEYTANWLGGVHYNSKRKSDSDEYRLLCSAMDWDDQAFMHAALVATAISCVEIIQSPVIKSLMDNMGRFYLKRKKRLADGIKLERTDTGQAA